MFLLHLPVTVDVFIVMSYTDQRRESALLRPPHIIDYGAAISQRAPAVLIRFLGTKINYSRGEREWQSIFFRAIESGDRVGTLNVRTHFLPTENGNTTVMNNGFSMPLEAYVKLRRSLRPLESAHTRHMSPQLLRYVRRAALPMVAAFAVALLFMGQALAATSAPKKTQNRQANSNATLEREIFGFTNKMRRQNGMSSLRPSQILQYVARRQSNHMCGTGLLRHQSGAFPKGWRTFRERLAKTGARGGGENLASVSLTNDPEVWAAETVHGWMNSPTHRKNILDPRFKYLGVGVRKCKNGVGYATQFFATGR